DKESGVVTGVHRIQQLPGDRVLVGQDGQLPYPVLAVPELLAPLRGNHLAPEPGPRLYQVTPRLASRTSPAPPRRVLPVSDELPYHWSRIVGQVAPHLVRSVLVAELKAVHLLNRVITHDQAHRALDGFRRYLSEDIPVRSSPMITFRRDLHEPLTQVGAANP